MSHADHSGHGMHSGMPTSSSMDHSMHSAMNHSVMDHSAMGHSPVDHSTMDHSSMDHSGMTESSDHGSHMMKMYFHVGLNDYVLFEGWYVDSLGKLIGSVIGIFIMAALYEGLKYYREYLFRKSYQSLQYSSVTVPTDKEVVITEPKSAPTRMLSWSHLFQTFLHVVQVVLSYFLMLIFMTYNVWLCLAVALGAAFGYFLFGWRKSIVVDITEHCH